MLEGDNLYVKLIDFGEAKIVDAFDESSPTGSQDKNRSSEDDNKSESHSFFSKMLGGGGGVRSSPETASKKRGAGTFVGTSSYQPPEMLRDNQSGLYTDLWALGCVIYELVNHGRRLFSGRREIDIHNQIRAHDFERPDGMDVAAADLVRQLTNPSRHKRLGLKNIEAIKQHQFFSGVDFAALATKKIQAPELDPPMMLARPMESFALIADGSGPGMPARAPAPRHSVPATPTFVKNSSGDYAHSEATDPR